MKRWLVKQWRMLTGKDLPSARSIAHDPDHTVRLPSVEDEKPRLPVVWFVVMGMAVAGFFVNVFMPGGLVVWPFVFAAAMLLIVNDASDRNAVGVPPFQAYALFFGILAGLFLFVALVSQINAWLIIALTIGAAVFVARDWAQRKAKQREYERLRAAGLCVRCRTPVGRGLDDVCSSCGLPSNLERVNLLRLGRAIGMRADAVKLRQVLTGQKPGHVAAKMQQLQQRRAARFAPAAKLGGKRK